MGSYQLLAGDGHEIRISTKKSWALLAYLAQSPGAGHSREVLAALLWPRSGEEQARASLRQELAVLRKTLTTHGIDAIISHKDTIVFQHDCFVIDTHLLEDTARSQDISVARKAREYYTGDLVYGLNVKSDRFDEWLRTERQRLRDVTLGCLLRVLENDKAQGDPEQISQCAHQILDVDNTVEVAHRAIMRSHNSMGRRAEALSQFKRCVEALHRELDAEPSEETTALYTSILQQSAAKAVDVQTQWQARPINVTEEKRELTIAVFGISNIAVLSNDLGAEDLADVQARFHSYCAATMGKFGGRLLDHFGDRVLVAFGYPLVDELDAERAVLAALQVVEHTQSTALPDGVLVSCGIASGESLVMPGNGPQAPPAQVTGPPVTKAIALEQQAGDNTLLVTSETLALLRYKFSFARVAGGEGGIEAYRVDGERPFASRFDVSEGSNTLTTLTGRQSELDQMITLWNTAKDGEGTSATVIGEAGIGKSRLIYSFLRAIKNSAPLILEFNGSNHHAHTALFPIAQGLSRFLGLNAGTDPADARTIVAKWLADLGLDTDQNRKVILQVLNHGGDGEAPITLTDKEKPVGTMVSCFLKLTQKTPVLFIFEDVQWMDSGSLDLLGKLRQNLLRHPMFVLATSRPVQQEGPARIDTRNMIELNRLDEAQALNMAQSLKPAHISDSQLSQIVDRSDGIPLFLEELINMVSLSEKAPGKTAAKHAIPASLQETLMARIDRMGQEKEILHIAAAIGRSFNHALLLDVARQDTETIEKYLQKLQEQDLVFRIGQPPYARYEFKHALVQELTYRSILRDMRTKYHERIALALSRDDRNSAAPEVIARHFEQAGQIERALDYYEAAGKQAVRVSAHHEAAKHFRKAVELARGLATSDESSDRIRHFLLLLGPQVLAEQGFASDEVQRVYSEALEMRADFGQDQQMSHILWGLWGYYIVRARIATAHDFAVEFLALADRGSDTLEIAAGHYMVGVGKFYTGEFEDARQSFEKAIQSSSSDQHDEMVIRYGVDLGITARAYLLWILALTSKPDEAVSQSRILQQEAEDGDHSFSAGFSHVFISGMYNFLGDFRNAEQHALVGMAMAEGHGFAQLKAQAKVNLGRALDRTNQTNGMELMREGLQEYMETGATLALPYVMAWLAEGYLDSGSWSKADNALKEALEFSSASGETYFDFELKRLAEKLGNSMSSAPGR
ncbi:BTAD domain-containing putative transcriptional regulator [Arenibacterium sp. CAU 1754]